MRIVEIAVLSNGAHRNQASNSDVLPDGWAVIPDDMELENFPFGEVTAEEVTHYRDVLTEKEVTKTREVEAFDEDGNPTTVTEEYTETETVTEQEPYTVLTVTGWIAGTIPEVEVENEPTEEDDTAAMLVDHEYRLTLLELGLTE